MAARRNNQAKRTGAGSGTPGWMWLLIGLVIGAVALLVVRKGDDGGFYTAQPRPNADATPAPVSGEDDEASPPKPVAKQPEPIPEARAATQYQFYDALLSGKEVAISDADLAARARSEQQQSQARTTAPAATPPASRQAPAIPQPIDETPAPATPAPSAKTTASVTPPASREEARYLLQAGAFAASGDAEATKAKIAMLGLSARVESAEINGKTVYRVRMGPYGSASELSEAKQKLASGGLQALAIKAQ